MAVQLWFTSVAALTHLGTNNAKLDTSAVGWRSFFLSQARGTDTTGTTNRFAVTVLGPTNGVELFISPAAVEWLSGPLSADFTISGTITLNLWAAEANMGDNAAINAVIEKIDGATEALTTIATTARITEVALVGAATVNNFTVTPTSTACKRGDRLRVRVFADDAGTMAAGGTMTFYYDRSTAAVQGDSWVQFNETLTFEPSTTPTGSTYYLRNTAETINPGGATEKKALTTRGASTSTAVTNTAAGWTAPIQITASAGGAAIEWYTPPLNAVSFGGVAKFNIRALVAAGRPWCSLKANIAVCNNDGTAPVIWGSANTSGAQVNAGPGGGLDVTDIAFPVWVAGDDTSVTSGQRLRFRILIDDCSDQPMETGSTASVTYDGASAAAAGDTYVILPVAVTEQVAAANPRRSSHSNQVAIARAAIR